MSVRTPKAFVKFSVDSLGHIIPAFDIMRYFIAINNECLFFFNQYVSYFGLACAHSAD